MTIGSGGDNKQLFFRVHIQCNKYVAILIVPPDDQSPCDVSGLVRKIMKSEKFAVSNNDPKELIKISQGMPRDLIRELQKYSVTLTTKFLYPNTIQDH